MNEWYSTFLLKHFFTEAFLWPREVMVEEIIWFPRHFGYLLCTVYFPIGFKHLLFVRMFQGFYFLSLCLNPKDPIAMFEF
jgi:hypothetical protein